MALTSAQITDVRRYAGYPLIGDMVVDDNRDFAYAYISPGVYTTLHHRLNNLSSDEEAVMVNVYLTNLNLLESDIPGSRANLDTDEAAVWVHNKQEQDDRTRLFDDWRRRMCKFIGIPPGPYLGDGGSSIKIVRA